MLWNLQALRGVACLLVVWYHLAPWADRFGVQLLVLRVAHGFGFAGVDLFFVISGFIIAHTNAGSFGRPGKVPGYLFRRLWRVYPPYWAAMALAAASWAAFFGHGSPPPAPAADWWRWLALAPGDPQNPVIGPAWTLIYEVMFYLAFGLLLVLPRGWATAGLVGWAAAVGVATAGGPAPAGAWAGLPFRPFVLEFLGGVLVSRLIGRGITGRGWAAAVIGIAWAAVVGGIARANTTGEWGDVMARHDLRTLIYGPAAVLIVYGVAAAEARGVRRPPRWLLRVGDASYSIYLTHTTVMLAAVAVWVMIPAPRPPRVPWLAGMFAACIGLGFLFHHAVERPLLSLVKRKKAPAAEAVRVGPGSQTPATEKLAA